jgi:RimJ/RimL family protein N-acetyltransferase
MDGPIIETERLILRPPLAEDFEPWAALYADEEAMRHLGGPVGRSPAWRAMCAMAGAWALHGFAMFSVVERATGRWIGRLGPWRPESWPGPEVGWALSPAVWGRGYAGEGASAAIDWAFDALDWDEVIHCIAPANAKSQAVAKKLGSRKLRVGRMPAPYDHDEVDIWGQTRAEWRARTS